MSKELLSQHTGNGMAANLQFNKVTTSSWRWLTGRAELHLSSARCCPPANIENARRPRNVTLALIESARYVVALLADRRSLDLGRFVSRDPASPPSSLSAAECSWLRGALIVSIRTS